MKRIKWMTAVIMVLAMLTAFTACSKTAGDSDAMAALKAENAQLKEQLAVLNARLNELESSGLKTWKLNARAWGDSNGATVSFVGEPRSHDSGESALFVVRMNGLEIENVTCDWDGSAYSASVELEAADGYSYSCILVAADGTREQMLLSSPDNPVYDYLVYMRSSLTAYCNLYIADWEQKDKDLTITSGYVQVQLPQITSAGTEVAFDSAQLVLMLNGNTIASQTLALPEGEGAGSYETALTDILFTMPDMAEDHQLDLDLHVKLSTGEEIVANGGSWYYNNGQLSMVVG